MRIINNYVFLVSRKCCSPSSNQAILPIFHHHFLKIRSVQSDFQRGSALSKKIRHQLSGFATTRLHIHLKITFKSNYLIYHRFIRNLHSRRKFLPISMKLDFSRNLLSSLYPNILLNYLQMPESMETGQCSHENFDAA